MEGLEFRQPTLGTVFMIKFKSVLYVCYVPAAFTLPGLSVYWVYVFVCAQLCLVLCDPWTVAHQTPLSMEFSRQESWRALLFPGDITDPEIEPTSLALADSFFPQRHLGKSKSMKIEPCLYHVCEPERRIFPLTKNKFYRNSKTYWTAIR